LVKLVLDASAGFELLLETVRGQALLMKVPAGAEWWVPEHYYVETAAALRRAEHRQLIESAQASEAFERLRVARLHRAQVRPLLEEAWSRRGHLTIADALYVVLAEHIGASLITADVNLTRSPNLSIPTITP
jgi:predicted nucleic acid-binding protein